ncbi:5-formyltetrahydrofolate cyclo-ligase [Sporosalibacterium faouarense]|uniref:5-formyltetrahydrofolate cyclo-ligase n=1 Tax=Sporosalibacterium faouarense TaxID=516123 RepID=UPI00192AA3AB|nr:5-formyltetrahydrofolate cyclo-ligase [Sporosalibacterium faouarense]
MESIWKKDVRRKMIDKRKKLNKSELEKLSDRIIEVLTKLPVFKQSKNVMLYLSFNNEVDSFKLINYCLGNMKRVIVPYCKSKGKEIIPTEIQDVKTELVKSNFGYLEPKPEYIRPVNLDDIDIIIIPGLAFDKRCFRIGYGAGYYDRFLAKVNKEIPKVGVAFDFQIIGASQMEKFDIPLDYVITEKRIIVR